MLQAVEAVIDEQGQVRLLASVTLSAARQALVIILEEVPSISTHELALLSEQALAEDWNRPEEDTAWSHLQPGQSSELSVAYIHGQFSRVFPGSATLQRGFRSRAGARRSQGALAQDLRNGHLA